MKIVVTGTACTGKSTFIKDFLEQDERYTLPSTTYREFALENNIPLNREGNADSQSAIMQCVRQQFEETRDLSNVIYDRGPMDVLAYSMSLFRNGIIEDDRYTVNQRAEAVKMMMEFDINQIFMVRHWKDMVIVEDGVREVDRDYIEEIDNIMNEVHSMPKFIRTRTVSIEGSRKERVKQANLYIKNYESIN